MLQSDTHKQVIADLLSIPRVIESIQAALEGESQTVIAELRSAVSSGNSTDAAIAEGKLRILEGITPLLERFSDGFSSHRDE
jgi:hypothetical protein